MLISRKQSFILAGGALVLFFAFSVSFLQCGTSLVDRVEDSANNVPSAIPQEEQKDEELQIVLNEFRRSETKDGKKLWEVIAKQGRYLPGQSIVEVEQATLWVFDNTAGPVKLQAEQATLHLSGTALIRAELMQDVRLNYNNLSVRTEKAIYEQEQGRVIAPGKVTIESDMLDITGNLLLADLNKKTATLQKNVRTTIKGKS